MDEVSYMVRGRTREQCQQALDRLCAALGARPTNPPADRIGQGWVARAIPNPTPTSPASPTLRPTNT